MRTVSLTRSFINVDALLRAGVHYGHKAALLKPAMRPYVLGNWRGINIVNVSKSLTALKVGFNIVFEAICANADVLFVCNGVSYARGVAYALADAEQHCVVSEFGGIVTNWSTFRGISSRLERYRRVVDVIRDKRLIAHYTRRVERSSRVFVSVPELECAPGAVVLFCGSSTDRVIIEANRTRVPVIGLADSLSEAAGIDCVVPACEGSNRVGKFMCELFASVCSKATLVSRRARLFGLVTDSGCVRIGDCSGAQTLSAACCYFKSVYLVPSDLNSARALLRVANALDVKLALFALLSLILCASVTLNTPLRSVINLCKLRLLVGVLSAAAAKRLRLLVRWLECVRCLVSAKTKPSSDAIAVAYGRFSSPDINVKDHIPQPVRIKDSHADYRKVRYPDFNVVGTFDYFLNLTKFSGK